MLKFGRLIDLERLEKLGVNKNADELKEKIQRDEIKRSKELGEWDFKIGAYREDLTSVIKENTVRLETLGNLTEAKKKLEDSLNYNQATVTAEYSGPQKKDVLERDRLIHLVQSQGQEIDVLKQEIELLIRKPIRQGLPLLSKKAKAGSPDIALPRHFEALEENNIPNAAEPRPQSRVSTGARAGQEISIPPATMSIEGEN